MPRFTKYRRGPTVAAVLLACLIAGAGSVAADDRGPTLLTIQADGSLEDWIGVRTNPANLTRDQDGSSLPCAETEDRDCIVPSNSGDLNEFAWTYDANSLYLYIQRFAVPTGNDAFWIHADLDRDGSMSQGEPLARIRFQNSSATTELDVFEYTPAGPVPDPITDAFGFSDGHIMPGDMGTQIYTEPPVPTGTGSSFEVEIPWAALGLPGPTPILFHFGVDNACCSPNATEDNLGGPTRGPGDLGFFLHHLNPVRIGSYAPNEPIEYLHTIRNDGNLPDTYNLGTFSSEGYDLELLEDVDNPPDGIPDVYLAFDRKGDGDFSASQDDVDPAADSDANGFPDTGLLQPGEEFHVVLRLEPTTGSKYFVERTRLTATSSATGEPVSVEDISAVGFVTMLRDLEVSLEPGTQARLCHQLTNHLPTSTLLDFEMLSIQGWDWTLWADPNNDCDPSDGAPLVSDSNADGRVDLNVPASRTITLVAVADVPAGTPLGSRETLEIRADSDVNNSIHAGVIDRVVVADLMALSPAYTLSNGAAKSGAPGTRLYFPHLLEYSGEFPDSFTLELTVPPPHVGRILSDPNGDGYPSDGLALGTTASTGAMRVLGGRFPFLVVLDIDASAIPGDQISLGLTAVSETNPTLNRTIQDEVTVTRVAAFRDPIYVQQDARYPLCSTIYGRAAGLVPGQVNRYRLQWYLDGGPTLLQEKVFSSDADGFGYDEIVLDTSFQTGTYSLVVQEWNGTLWSELDRDQFEVDDFGVLEELSTDKSTYLYQGEDLGIRARFLNDDNGSLRGQLIRYAVLNQDRTRILQLDGTFVPVQPDLWTRTSDAFNLAPGEAWEDGFTISNVQFPGAGVYFLQAFGEGSCGRELARVEAPFEVIADSDNDGWLDEVEIQLGTDPYDRDTDDDGLLDPFDGDTDTDGDTLIAALDCDSDDDGLPDGLEHGLTAVVLDPDTDVSAGCFLPDADAGDTTTDRFNPDSDDGGELDGAEDLNKNGVVDAGEKDPRDATDDPCAWTAPPEVGDLRVSRNGRHLILGWEDLASLDPCVSYQVLEAQAPPAGIEDFGAVVPWTDVSGAIVLGGADMDGSLRFYLVSANGRIGGAGPLGHYQQ